jgi:hypothetical protein
VRSGSGGINLCVATFAEADDLLIVGLDPDTMMRHVAGLTKEADITDLNLEGYVYDRGQKIGIGRGCECDPFRAWSGASAPACRRRRREPRQYHVMDFQIEELEHVLQLPEENDIRACDGS